MNNRERVLAAISFRETERIPYHIALTQQMQDRLVAEGRYDEYLSKLNNHMDYVKLREGVTEIAPGFFRDSFGVVWNRTIDRDIGVVDELLIPDIERVDDYAVPEVNEAHVHRQCEALMAMPGENFKLASVSYTLFERAWSLCGMENLLCAMITNPDEVHRLLRRLTDYQLKVIGIALSYDIDCVLTGDDWGQQRGLIMGPKLWREFIRPYYEEMWGAVRRRGVAVAHHSCGDISGIIDDVVGMGLQIYQTYQPEIYGLERTKRVFDGRLSVWGGISTQQALPIKTAAEITDITREMVRVMARHGGYIGAPTHAVTFDTPADNLFAMLDVFNAPAER